MNFNGKERLEEITEPQIVEPPKKMFVWRNGYKQPLEDLVVAIVKRADGICAMTFDGDIYPNCAEIPEKPKPRRATWKELAYWLIDGKGLVLDENRGKIDTGVIFSKEDLDAEISDYLKVMLRDDADWHEPDVKYMGIEDYAEGK